MLLARIEAFCKNKMFTPTHFYLNPRLKGSFLKTQQHLLRAVATVISTASVALSQTREINRGTVQGALQRRRQHRRFAVTCQCTTLYAQLSVSVSSFSQETAP